MIMAKLSLFTTLIVLSGILQVKSDTTTEAMTTTKLFRTRRTTVDRGRGATCTDLPQRPRGYSNFPAGTKIRIECPDGYTFKAYQDNNNDRPDYWANNNRRPNNDQQSAICENDGTWDRPFGYCQRIGGFCPLPITGPYVQIIQQSNTQSPNQFEQGSFIQYGCINGYLMSGASRLTCNSDGTWYPNQPPTCGDGGLNYCPLPITGPYVQIIQQSTTQSPNQFPQGGFIQYGCTNGYVMSGASRLTCNSDGTWYPNQPPTCNGGSVIVNDNDCYLPQTPSNGNIMSQSSPIGDGTGLNFAPNSQISYTCNPGYVMVGASTITCSSYGRWQPNPPLCQVSGYRANGSN